MPWISLMISTSLVCCHEPEPVLHAKLMDDVLLNQVVQETLVMRQQLCVGTEPTGLAGNPLVFQDEGRGQVLDRLEKVRKDYRISTKVLGTDVKISSRV
uniref:Uncharacterized protein n=1 Tax=Chromera velia CCMP2878 TaxID=1169474 RepID=A0A0G4I9X9_9ALVE|eukprot:Cvel_2085.t1-p1 / transcript=Cvel_2085.t1 / gene=Cvel_2085 / organism=Chromera_velia_CCMP2878 / gene_product=hypothetical protein / transcript_product=hypothetical protein / location=Cvel_scaffold80:115679-116028(-) / protein_length=98 / sequence_SO=supercontig / SO=protein_coding / is_pseudo=false